MSISSYARAYADALDALERARSWMKSVPKEARASIKVHLAWVAGSHCTGYSDLSAIIGDMVTDDFEHYLSRAMERLEYKQKCLSIQLEGAQRMGSRGEMRAGDVPKEEAATVDEKPTRIITINDKGLARLVYLADRALLAARDVLDELKINPGGDQYEYEGSMNTVEEAREAMAIYRGAVHESGTEISE
jgi:hypothetical protein